MSDQKELPRVIDSTGAAWDVPSMEFHDVVSAVQHGTGVLLVEPPSRVTNQEHWLNVSHIRIIQRTRPADPMPEVR